VVQSEKQPSGMMRTSFGNEWWPDEGGRQRWRRKWQRSAPREREKRRDRAGRKGLHGLNFSSVAPTGLTWLVDMWHKWLDHETNGVTQSHHSRWLMRTSRSRVCALWGAILLTAFSDLCGCACGSPCTTHGELTHSCAYSIFTTVIATTSLIETRRSRSTSWVKVLTYD
jgi:hypothetical protein